MEVVGVLLSLIFLYALYHVIRVGVRDGMTEAFKRRDIQIQDEDTSDKP
jgi:hypothetical protein